MTQELRTLEKNVSSMQDTTDIVSLVKYDARIESFAKYMLTLRSEQPKISKTGNVVLIDNADNTNTAA